MDACPAFWVVKIKMIKNLYKSFGIRMYFWHIAKQSTLEERRGRDWAGYIVEHNATFTLVCLAVNIAKPLS